LFLMSSSIAKAQVTFPNIDVQHYTFAITLNDANDNIKGKADVTIKFTGNVNEPELNLVKKNNTGKGMLVSSINEDGKVLKIIHRTKQRLILLLPRQVITR